MSRAVIVLAVVAAAWFVVKDDNIGAVFSAAPPAAAVKDSAEDAEIVKWQKMPGFYRQKLYVQDGDSLIAGKTHIRLLCIDAPEKGQHYGDEAKAFLAMLVKNGADIRTGGKDQYGRLLAVVIVNIDGKRTIANNEMVRRGYAWAYRKFIKTCGLPERSLSAMEDNAREAKRGLWQQQNPTPPWQWRYENRR